MTARCELTELLVDQCDHCRPAPTRPVPRGLGPWVEAIYDGECVDCGDPIEPGDPIRSDGSGGWLGGCCGIPGRAVETVTPRGGLL